MYNEYALIENGVLKKILSINYKPEDIPHKSLVWLPVLRNQFYDRSTHYEHGVETTIYKDRVEINSIVLPLSESQIKKRKKESLEREFFSNDKQLGNAMIAIINYITGEKLSKEEFLTVLAERLEENA